MSKLIQVNKKNNHLIEVVLNRPEKLNAMTKPMWIELGKVFKTLSKNPFTIIFIASFFFPILVSKIPIL